MVRRDEVKPTVSRETEQVASRCTSPAGASPAPVSVGAPGSRPQVVGREALAQAGCRKPLRREQERGPQHEVKPAAPTELQRGSRAAHVTAKATSTTGTPEHDVVDPSGVRGAARVQGEGRNTGDPSASPRSRQGGSYKSKTKTSAAQRESEGAIVLTMDVQKNASGGRGPCFGHVRGEGTSEGMAGTTGPNHPGTRSRLVKAQQPQGELWAAAKSRTVQRASIKYTARDDVRAEMALYVDRCATQATQRRPSVSRVREIRTHGLKGGSALSPMNYIV